MRIKTPPTEEPHDHQHKPEHPWWHMLERIAAIVGVISFPLSIYLYFAAVSTPGLSYTVNPSKAIVVKAGQTSAIKILVGGNPVTSDITAAQVAIWNGGRTPINRDDILQPFTISTEKGIPIIEATIRKKNRDTPAIKLDKRNLAKGKLGVSWRILEKNDGAVIQIVYAGNPETKLTASSVVVGQSTVHEISEKASAIDEAEKSFFYDKRFLALMSIFGLLFCPYLMYRAFQEVRYDLEELISDWRFLLLFGVACLCIIYIVITSVIRLYSFTAKPPFDF